MMWALCGEAFLDLADKVGKGFDIEVVVVSVGDLVGDSFGEPRLRKVLPMTLFVRRADRCADLGQGYLYTVPGRGATAAGWVRVR